MFVVIASEFVEIPREFDHLPEKHVVEVLVPDRADQPLNERMRNWGVRNRLDLLDPK